ncbi:hypothetical protein C1646_772808 [Rhizophagus diaphanus]|nr:hypothetical protein C1646_772808 [Rhizophagus diaphanus] [Rhizophagus sp. MUCL 43196]
MGGKYLPVPAQDPYNGNANINSPATLRAWMRSHYQRETVGVADNDAQTIGFLKNYLSGDLYTWMQAVAPAELEKRLGVIEINLAKLTKLVREDTIDTKSAQKDTRGTKTPQRQRSESSPFGGLEKRLEQIEALLAKLVKDSKSRSSRVNMAIVDEQSDPIFSDDDTLKLEDNDYNSDNSSAKPVRQCGYPDKSLKSKVSSKSELRKVKQDNNLSSTHNALSDKDSHDSDEEDILDGPMEINFIRKKEPATDVITVKCKIKRLVILAGTVDPGANFLIMSEDISERSKLEIDTKEKYDLRDIATIPIESLDTVRNIPVNFAPRCTIYADFAVVS